MNDNIPEISDEQVRKAYRIPDHSGMNDTWYEMVMQSARERMEFRAWNDSEQERQKWSKGNV
jgi:hypothetical protein